MVLDEPQENESAKNVNGIDVLVSPEVEGYADGSVIDYRNSWYGKGFVVRGTGSC